MAAGAAFRTAHRGALRRVKSNLWAYRERVEPPQARHAGNAWLDRNRPRAGFHRTRGEDPYFCQGGMNSWNLPSL